MPAGIKRKPKGSYHHPDLAQGLTQAAIRMIREDGVDAVTLRDIGSRLGVSRTAIYRHFKDKSALLARVATEGFRLFRAALQTAVEGARAAGSDPIEAMGLAYVRFALTNESHYKTMFGDACGSWELYPELIQEASGAFEVLLQTTVEEQAASRIAASLEPLQVAHILWANVHGIATLGMAGHLGPAGMSGDGLEDLCRAQHRITMAGLRTAPATRAERAV